ncbi:hypothetical protein D3P09_12080 [Paenibacillus pinisoli]|uniref:CoF synthetase n=1 Tax=Paenibacillus pinisoli TaxID=1276110 RepID=A0A3A6PEJ9_9BACL|nr:hypothetical protein [Paenibacillus pinisoli]RJX40102.1 hypothetical protein D3P09_12080 [Paenibacillus pinisoli]
MMEWKLNDQLRHIARLHPWYEPLLRLSGITLSEIDRSPPALSQLPLIDTEALERHYYGQAERTESGLSVYRTSGTSTGIRKAIYYSPEDDRRYIEAKTASYLNWLGNDHGITRAMADLGTGHAASTAIAIFRDLGIEAEAIPFTAPVEEHVARLALYGPQLLYTMPSILEAIADAHPSPRSLRIRKIILVGELASAEWQANMAARFGIGASDVLDTYGSIEVGAIAAFSHELGRYVLSEDVYGESLPGEMLGYGPLGPGEGVLVLTSFSRTLFPAVRYVTCDVVRDFRIMAHEGRTLHTFACITKRIGPELKHGEKISLYDIEEAVNRHLRDALLRVRVESNKLRLYIKSSQLDERTAAAIRYDVEHQIGDIGMMIRNRLLQGIEVIHVSGRDQLPAGAVKAKKLYQ